MLILRKKIFCFIIPLFLFVIFLINPFFVSGQSKNYLLNCVGREIIKVSSDGSVIYDGNTLLSETSPVAVTVREMIVQYEQGSAEDRQRMLADISTKLNTTCTVSEEPGMTLSTTPPLKFKPEVGFPGFKATTTVDGSLLGSFVSSIFQYLLYASSVFAVIMVSIAGFKWIIAGGNTSKISEAKNKMITSLIGLFLCFSSVLILQTINTDLINFRPITIQSIIPVEFIDRFEYQNNYDTNSFGMISGPGNSWLFQPEIIAGIKKWAPSVKDVDNKECLFYAIIHQESGANPIALSTDSNVTCRKYPYSTYKCSREVNPSCGMDASEAYSRVNFICKQNPGCCSGGKIGNSCVCDLYNIDKQIDGSNWLSYITDPAYTFGLGLGQITKTAQTRLCNNNTGIIFHNKCFTFESLLSIDGNLEAMSLGWNGYYGLRCNQTDLTHDSGLVKCFQAYHGGTKILDPARAKLLRYKECIRLGFENIAANGIP